MRVFVFCIKIFSVSFFHGTAVSHVHELLKVGLHILHEQLAGEETVAANGGRCSYSELGVLPDVIFDRAGLDKVINLAYNQSVGYFQCKVLSDCVAEDSLSGRLGISNE